MALFPELTSRVKGWLPSLGSKPIQLDLKAAMGLTFDAVNVGWYARNGFPGIYSILSGGLPAWSGEAVSVESALNHSVVWACNRIISESVGMTPALMYREQGRAKQPATQHPMYRALKHAPNDEVTAMAFTEMLTGHTVLQGGGFAQIHRRSGTNVAFELNPLMPQCVTPDREKTKTKRLVYIVKDGNEPERTYTVVPGKPHDILHIRGLGWDGIRGYSVITMARQSVGTAIAMERNVARFYANGGRVPYALRLDRKFATDQDFERFRADWERVYAEPHRAPMMEPPVAEYIKLGLSAADAQMLQSREFTVSEICRWFRVSPHLVGDLSRATFANIEQLALEFVKFTLTSWLERWEQDMWRCILTPDEKEAGYFWYHDVDALLRGDFASRMAGYATMLQNGIASVNEVRYREGLNPIDGGDDHHIQLNMQSLPGGTPTASQTAALVKLGKAN